MRIRLKKCIKVLEDSGMINRLFNSLNIKTAKVDDIIKLEDAEEYLNLTLGILLKGDCYD